MTPMPLSRLCSMVSTSPLRTVTDWPWPSRDVGLAGRWRRRRGVRQHVGGDLAQLRGGVAESPAAVDAHGAAIISRAIPDEIPSKTQKKREMHGLQTLGAALVHCRRAS